MSHVQYVSTQLKKNKTNLLLGRKHFNDIVVAALLAEDLGCHIAFLGIGDPQVAPLVSWW